MRRRSRTVSKSEAIFALVLCLLLGTVFVFLEGYAQAPAERQELRYVDAAYQSYRYVHSGRHGSMTLYFEDHEACDIAMECVDDALLQRLDAIAPGTVLRLGLHPNSNTILEISDHGRTVMEFAEIGARLALRRRGFLLLGLFLYAGAGWCLYLLVRGKTK